jgi:hypothetical protein
MHQLLAAAWRNHKLALLIAIVLVAVIVYAVIHVPVLISPQG